LFSTYPSGGDTEGVLVIFDLFVEAGDGVVKGVDGGLVRLFPRLDGGSEGMDDVDQEGCTPVMQVALSDKGGSSWGNGRSDEVRVVKHGTRPQESKALAGGGNPLV
jgi:hypothetical protein